ncbi:hypothetical protein [Methylotuvimicrobium buryatense]|uniref:ATP-binding protein n=1 Tax=Methylotuvimicrobium buryatense TaxID=95641 RepID=A0A4P9UNP4_METBY|nr:hypothetical protein [Methylotuvimicrobium buryatense]QCW82100.1 hypothetical protein EQU24_07450 [Methylotuvimicrobium buryatense]
MEAFVQVDTHYTRSINLERDIDSSPILNAYIPTSKAMLVLNKIASTFNDQSMPRAWSLVGPYGSGKSSFAIFLTHLLEHPNYMTSVTAEGLLTKHNPALAQKYIAHTQESNAYCTVILTGSSESLSRRLLKAMHWAAESFWQEKQGKKPSIIKELAAAAQEGATVSEILALLHRLKQAVLHARGRGVLIVIDELGKFLEYEARHQGANDIYLLQALAEYAYKGGEANVLLVVLMHQAFEQYSKGLGETLLNEWVKVQGRFESIPFLESAEQTLRVVAAAFKSNLTESQRIAIRQQTQTIISVLAKQNALPVSVSAAIAEDILAKCYPLHPIAALILPVLCQKVAQNERTLFSYLGSQEHYGFQDGLKRLHNVGDWVPPWEIFEYFILNQPSMTSDHATHRRWTEVLIAIERLGDAKDSEIKLLKTIGLFNIMGAHGGLKASYPLLQQCFPDTDQVIVDLESLQTKSIITYRKFSAEYRIWEGSDFDLEAQVNEVTQQLGRIDLSDVLNKRKTLLPIVARRYSIATGTLRYFQPIYASSQQSLKQIKQNDSPRIIFFLAEDSDALNAFYNITKEANELTLFALCNNVTQLYNAIVEVLALERIQTESPEIKSDPVAGRELKDRLNAARQTEAFLLNQILEQPEQNLWIWRADTLNIANKKTLQHQLSTILQTVYAKTPIIKNELVNRNKISAQASSARNKLVAALLNHAHLEDLGFDSTKYPPEKSIYRAVFKETGIHVNRNGFWQIVEPSPDNAYQLFRVWQGIDNYLKSDGRPQPLTALYKLLSKPPYGIKQGVVPLLFIAYYLSKQRSLALYESGVFCPHVSQEYFEILLKRPELFSIEAFDFSGIRADLFNQYLEKLVGKSPENSTLLDIVKPLAKFIHQLPPYTLASRNLDQKAQAVRDAFQNTQSPMQLLFKELPEACGFHAYTDETHFNDSNPNDFLNVLVESLNILNKAYQNLLVQFQQQLSQAFDMNENVDLKSLRQTLKQRYSGLENYTIDGVGLKAFIIRLQNDKDTDTAWLESVAAFLGKAPPDKWKPNNTTEAAYRLIELSGRLKELAIVHAEQQKAEAGSEATLIRIVSENGEYKQVAYLTEELKEQADAKIAELKLDQGSQALKQAILARLIKEWSS